MQYLLYNKDINNDLFGPKRPLEGNMKSVVVLLVVGLALWLPSLAEAGEWSLGPFTLSFEVKVELPKAEPDAYKPIVWTTPGGHGSWGTGQVNSSGPTGTIVGPVGSGTYEKVGPDLGKRRY